MMERNERTTARHNELNRTTNQTTNTGTDMLGHTQQRNQTIEMKRMFSIKCQMNFENRERINFISLGLSGRGEM